MSSIVIFGKRSLKESNNDNHIPKFLSILYDLLEVSLSLIQNHSEYWEFIEWDNNGSQFVVKNIENLTTKILPTMFRHTNYSSFVRQVNFYSDFQLNIYGFHKGKDENGCDVFRHDIFLKGKRDLLCLIKRNQKKPPIEAKKITDKNLDIEYMKKLYNKIDQLRSDQNELEHLINQLEYKNEKLDFTSQIILGHICHK